MSRRPYSNAADEAQAPTGRADQPRTPSRRREVENPDHAAFFRRFVRAHARRIATGDVEGLTDLLDLAVDIDTATRAAVEGLRAAGYSWAEIARRTGIIRQAAQQQWGQRAAA